MAHIHLYSTSTTWFAFQGKLLCIESNIAYARETPFHPHGPAWCLAPTAQDAFISDFYFLTAFSLN